MDAQSVLNVARSQLGIEESPAGSNRTKYGAWYGMDGNPWCAMFVSWCFNYAGEALHITTDKGYSYCPFGVNYFKHINRWSTSPSAGAIVFYGNNGLAEHTGIVESFTSTAIVAIEGNTSVGNNTNGGEVMRRTRLRNSWIIGYGLPEYTQELSPMFNPALVLRPIVAELNCPTGGAWLLGDDGSIYAFGGAPYLGGANGQGYFFNRKPATLELPNAAEAAAGKHYTIVATSSERYSY
jgi:hypothetical protein